MSIILFEGFDDIDSPANAGFGISDQGNVTIDTANYYMDGVGSIKLSSANAGLYLHTPSFAYSLTTYVGFAYKSSSVTNSSLAIYYYGTGAQCNVAVNSNGSVSVLRTGNSLVTSSTGLISANTWYYIEIKATIANSTATNDFVVKIDGSTVATVPASSDTQAQTSTGIDLLYLGQSASSNTVNIDDLYFLDTNGSSCNTFLVKSQVRTYRPGDNGYLSEWLGSDGNSTNNYLLVDDTNLESADYVETDTVNAIDAYKLAFPSKFPATAHAAKVRAYCSKDSVGPRSYAAFVRQNSTNSFCTTRGAPASDFVTKDEYLQTNPITTAAWTVDDLDKMEIGVKLIA